MPRIPYHFARTAEPGSLAAHPKAEYCRRHNLQILLVLQSQIRPFPPSRSLSKLYTALLK